MNILFLTQVLPYPPDAGPKVKTWHVLRYLIDRGHQVTLASFVRQEEEEFVPVLEELCSSVFTVPILRSRLSDIVFYFRSNLTRRPFLVERDDILAMRKLVNSLISSSQIDVIHADQLTMTQYALPIYNSIKKHKINLSNSSRSTDGLNDTQTMEKPLRIFDAHNAVWTITDRMGDNALWPLGKLINLETNRIKSYEGLIVNEFEHTLAVTEQDRLALKEAFNLINDKTNGDDPAVTVIPIAVDTTKLIPIERKKNSLNIITLGTLHYPPNTDGIRWFVREIFPLVQNEIPGVSLTIIGKNPPTDFIKISSQNPDTIKVTGYVPDLTPYLEESAIMVIPVRAGGGMRVRILEAFSRAIPVVTTTIGLEGIDAVPQEDILVEDTPNDFASAVVRLLKDNSLQSKLAKNSRRLAINRYDWRVVLQSLDIVYQDLERRLI